MKLDAAAERAMREKQKLKEQSESESKDSVMKERIEKLVETINGAGKFRPLKALPPDPSVEKPVVVSESKEEVRNRTASEAASGSLEAQVNRAGTQRQKFGSDWISTHISRSSLRCRSNKSSS